MNPRCTDKFAIGSKDIFRSGAEQPLIILLIIIFPMASYSFLPIYIYIFKMFIYWLSWVFVATSAGATSCSKQELLSSCGVQASFVVERGLQQLRHMGLVVLAPRL